MLPHVVAQREAQHVAVEDWQDEGDHIGFLTVLKTNPETSDHLPGQETKQNRTAPDSRCAPTEALQNETRRASQQPAPTEALGGFDANENEQNHQRDKQGRINKKHVV